MSPRVLAKQNTASLFLFVNQSVSFHIHGRDNREQILFTVDIVTVTGGLDAALPLPGPSIHYNPRLRWTAMYETMFVATGLDRT